MTINRHDLIKVYENLDYLATKLDGQKDGVGEIKNLGFGFITSHVGELFKGMMELNKPETEEEEMLRLFRVDLGLASHAVRNSTADRTQPATATEVIRAIRFFKVFEQRNVRGKQGIHFNAARAFLISAPYTAIYDSTPSWTDDYEDERRAERYG